MTTKSRHAIMHILKLKTPIAFYRLTPYILILKRAIIYKKEKETKDNWPSTIRTLISGSTFIPYLTVTVKCNPCLDWMSTLQKHIVIWPAQYNTVHFVAVGLSCNFTNINKASMKQLGFLFSLIHSVLLLIYVLKLAEDGSQISRNLVIG